MSDKSQLDLVKPLDPPCIHTLKRKWWGLPLDVITMGGYRVYQTHSYSVCLSKVSDEEYRTYIVSKLKTGF
jgi:hypothetical protein